VTPTLFQPSGMAPSLVPSHERKQPDGKLAVPCSAAFGRAARAASSLDPLAGPLAIVLNRALPDGRPRGLLEGRRHLGKLLSLAGAGSMGAAAYLGGHMSFARSIGVGERQ
jgi:hypothetical protein